MNFARFSDGVALAGTEKPYVSNEIKADLLSSYIVI